MEKIWYVFIENHHRGTFSSEEIFKMFYSDQIVESTLVWRQGMTKWIQLKNCDELWQIIAPMPALPELPPEVIIPTPPPPPPPAPTQEIITPQVEEKVLKSPKKTALNFPKINLNKRFIFISFASLMTCFGLYFLVDSILSVEAPPPMQGISLLESTRLINISQVRLREGVKVGLAASLSEKSIYFSSNRSGPMTVTLDISSLPQRILGEDTIRAFSEARLEGHFAVFNSFHFSFGKRFLPGYYKVHLEAVSLLTQRSILNQFIEWGLLSKEGHAEKFTYEGELFISDTPASRFDEELKNYQTKIYEESVFPYVDLKERYNTLYSFCEQFYSFFEKQVALSKEGFDQKVFEKAYASELGHIFQMFVEDTIKMKEESLRKNKNLTSDFENLTSYAETVGALIFEMSSKGAKLAQTDTKKIRKKGREEFINYFSVKIGKIKTELKNKQNIFELKINNNKKSQ